MDKRLILCTGGGQTIDMGAHGTNKQQAMCSTHTDIWWPAYGTICQVIGDNLWMHSILGFTESSSWHYSCRLCLTEKADVQLVYIKDDFMVILHDCTIYEQHCSELESYPKLKSTHGLKRNSTLNSLQYFHVCHNYSLDVMHDLLEGVSNYKI